MTDPMEALRARFRERCATDLADLEAMMNSGVRSGVELRRIVHGLSGSGGTFGFPALSEAASPVDDAIAEGQPVSDRDLEALITALRKMLS